MASQVPAKKGAAYTLYFTLYKNDGTVIANPGTITKKISKDGGTVADCANSVTEIDTTYGACSLVLSSTEMNADAVWVQLKDDTAGCVPQTFVIYTTASLMQDMPDAILDRDMSVGTDSGSATVRTVRQALRFLRNKWSLSGSTLTVTKEDDTTASWTATVTTNAAADPITGSDPASS